MSAGVTYRVGDPPPLDEIVALYRGNALGARRPVDDRSRMARMFANANLVVTAWDGAQLVGLARAMSDFGWSCYLADLLVRDDWQGRGVGRELIRRTHEAAGGEDAITLVLVSAPDAMGFYEHIGLERVADGWRRPRRVAPAGYQRCDS